ncbi:hypothetical protein [Rubrivirga sp. IMCC45206]|uniref:hypothetical protein n=1 Tax=Rubrivirga sp. IMCC45206 TaxID=3391614 RepID=UPI00398FAC06
MGKTLLLLVLGSSVILGRQLLSNVGHEVESNKDQQEYQEEVIAREIAASAFNIAMGEVRSHGEDLHTAVTAFNGAAGGRSGTFTTGRFTGGSFESEAKLTSGHSVQVIAVGKYGRAEYTMHDEYRIPVLIAREDGLIEVDIPNDPAIDPDACTALFYQAYPIGTDPAALPAPEMVMASWNGVRDKDHLLQTIYASAGTQMNFFLAVDSDCSERPLAVPNTCEARADARDHTYDASTWEFIHHALVIDPDDVDQAEEGPWAYVEQDASDRQSWRISWEDTPNWDAPNSTDPLASLQALATLGYNGGGWSFASGTGYILLQDLGLGAPDYADQSIVVTVYEASNPNFHGKQRSALAKQKECGEEYDEPIDGGGYDVDGETGDGETDVPPAPPDESPDQPEPDDAEYPDDDGFTSDEITAYACKCTNNGRKDHKTAILHRPPGNEANEHLICIGNPAVPSHFDNHNDVFPTCESGRAVQNNNKKK